MKRQELLNLLDETLLEQLYGYCYRRCASSYEAQDLCSEMLLAIVKAGNRGGEVDHALAFLWKIARNVYADYSERRTQESMLVTYEGFEDRACGIADPEPKSGREDETRLRQIWREISFLSRAYREVMILFYLEGASVRDIAAKLGLSETAVRQRLFSARNAVRKEVTKMKPIQNKPVALQKLKLTVWGTGNPGAGDPRDVFHRQFSKHVVWLCRNVGKTAKEISGLLNVPMTYVEEELDIQVRGGGGGYGMLWKTDSGKYITNFVLLNAEEMELAWSVYCKRIPAVTACIEAHIAEHEKQYLAFPYLNRTVSLNLILWQQISDMVYLFNRTVAEILEKQYFPEIPKSRRPFSVFGYEDKGEHFYGGGWDGVNANNVCGFSDIHLDNIYISRIKAHFHCGLNIANDLQIQMALRAIHGLSIAELNGQEKEIAAKAVECGYLYRDGDILYTKILVCGSDHAKELFRLNEKLCTRYRIEAEQAAREMADLIRTLLPEHLLPDYTHANTLASLPVVDEAVERLIDRGILTPPENGIGAEGCWMTVG